MTRKHGGAMYKRHQCHDGPDGRACDVCREGNRLAQQRADARRRARLAADPTVVPHGRASTYTNWGCRCDECFDAYRQKALKRYTGRTARRRAYGFEQRAQPFGREWLNA